MKFTFLSIILILSLFFSCTTKEEKSSGGAEVNIEVTKSSLGNLPDNWKAFLNQEHENNWHHRRFWAHLIDIEKSLENGYPTFTEGKPGTILIDYYDQDGKLISSHEFTNRFKIQSTTRNTYNEDGEALSSILDYHYDKEDDTLFLNTFNHKGQLIKKVNFGRDIHYQYDKKGNLIYKTDGYEPEEHSYDQENRRVKTVFYNDDGSIYKTTNISYVGNLRREENIISDRPFSVYFYEDDDLIKFFNFTSDGYKVQSRYYTGYDEKNRPKSKTECTQILEERFVIPDELSPCTTVESFTYETIDSLGFNYELTHTNFVRNMNVLFERIEENENFEY